MRYLLFNSYVYSLTLLKKMKSLFRFTTTPLNFGNVKFSYLGLVDGMSSLST